MTVNVGRAGAANLDVIQEVEYVKQEAKIVYLLECLQKTAPPVLIFAENKKDVDDIHEYLLLKGVEAAAIHGNEDMPAFMPRGVFFLLPARHSLSHSLSLSAPFRRQGPAGTHRSHRRL